MASFSRSQANYESDSFALITPDKVDVGALFQRLARGRAQNHINIDSKANVQLVPLSSYQKPASNTAMLPTVKEGHVKSHSQFSYILPSPRSSSRPGFPSTSMFKRGCKALEIIDSNHEASFQSKRGLNDSSEFEKAKKWIDMKDYNPSGMLTVKKINKPFETLYGLSPKNQKYDDKVSPRVLYSSKFFNKDNFARKDTHRLTGIKSKPSLFLDEQLSISPKKTSMTSTLRTTESYSKLPKIPTVTTSTRTKGRL